MMKSDPKREARKLLGLMDENLNRIHSSDQCREALLTSVELLRIRIRGQDAASKAERESLLAIIKSAKKAKALANKRADEAEAALKKVRKALASIDALTSVRES